MRTESYIKGEELTTGKSVEEAVYDAKGHLVKSFKYNSLDTSSKFYTESVYAEDGAVTAEKDKTGARAVEYEYIEGTTVVRSERYANGSVLSYGHDADDNVTALTQSTAEGEENSTQLCYTCGEVTELVSGNNVVRYEYDAKRRVTAIDLNGTEGYETYAYNEGSSEDSATVKNAKGETFVTAKDKFGNVLHTMYAGAGGTVGTYESSGCVRFTYDAYHNVTKEEDKYINRTRTYEYENAASERLQKVTAAAGTDAEALTESYTYNEYGELTKREIAGAVTQTYDYQYKDNAAREVEYVLLPNGLRSYPQRDKLGRNTGKELTDASGQRKFGEYLYYRKVGDHATNMPSAVYFGNERSGKYMIRDNVKYEYDVRGNICKMYENGMLSVRYAYDSIDRLIREDNRALGYTWVYSYDNNGNILSKRRKAFTLKTNVEECEFTETLYSYDGDKLLSFGNEACEYDVIGNPTTYRGKTAGWERGRLLNYLNGNSFGYDGQGRRIKKNTTVFTYDAEGNLVKQSDGLEFVYDTNGVSSVKYINATYFYRKDAQGNIIALLDGNGNIVVQYKYDAWGNHTVLDANGDEIFDASHIGNRNPFRYRGYYYDTETDLYYLQTRYYDPETGRFITIDGIEYLDPETINGLNLYAYCGNNPVMRTDENGTEWWHWLIGALIVVAVAALVVVTAGAAAVAIGATAATVNAVMVSAAVGGLVAGGTNLLMQGVTTNWQTVDYGSLALSTFVGGVSGAISGGFGQLSAGVASGTRLLAHKGFQTAVNVMLSWGGYAFSSAVRGEELTLDSLIFATLGGFISGVTFNWATIPALGLLVGLEFIGYTRDIINYIRGFFNRVN